MTLNAGQALLIPAGTIHAAKNVGTGNAAELATYRREGQTARGAGQVSRRSDGPLIAVPTITLRERNAHPASAAYSCEFSGKYVHVNRLPYWAQLVARAAQAFAAPSSTWTPFDRVVLTSGGAATRTSGRLTGPHPCGHQRAIVCTLS